MFKEEVWGVSFLGDPQIVASCCPLKPKCKKKKREIPSKESTEGDKYGPPMLCLSKHSEALSDSALQAPQASTVQHRRPACFTCDAVGLWPPKNFGR